MEQVRERLSRLSADDPLSSCRLWTGHIGKSGYGRITLGKRKVGYAHRVSFEVSKGTIPAGMEVMHSCDVRNCINPEHLSLGTPKENMADRDRKGRRKIPRHKGENCPWAKLSEDQMATIRERAMSGERQRAIAVDFGIAQSLVSMIKTRKRWANI